MKPDDCKLRTECSLCGLKHLTRASSFSNFSTPIANEYLTKAQVDELGGWNQDVFPLDLYFCVHCGHVQLQYLIKPERLFSNYKYTTSTSIVTQSHLAQQASQLRKLFSNPSNRFAVEIGCNDGFMLGQLKHVGFSKVVGVDPAAEITDSSEHKNDIVVGFFDEAMAKKLKDEHGQADLIVANNVLAHVPSVRDVLKGVENLLADGGYLSVEVAYLGDILKYNAFDTIYHEHTSYHTLAPLAKVLDEMGMPIVMVSMTPNQVGRGSLAILCQKKIGSSMQAENVRSALLKEQLEGIGSNRFFQKAYKKREDLTYDLNGWIAKIKASGQRIVGFGAPAKLTTLMYGLSMSKHDIEFVVDDSPWKQGLFTPGHHLPILHPSSILKEKGTCLIFAWNFAFPIIAKNSDFEGTWLIPLPNIQESRGLR